MVLCLLDLRADTDTFIETLRKLIARRVNVKQTRSDNGPNFVGAV